jgi:peptidoglycan L-alanyl-D-glutamate endopeptidase CwlK
MEILRKGASGPAVLKMQNALAKRGFRPGACDGQFGEGTEAALKAFQRSEGLFADGVCGTRSAVALGLANLPAPASAIPGVTPEIVCRMFPATPAPNIEANLPVVLDALVAPQLVEKPMVLMALATIRAETECFLPLSEGVCPANTSPGGHPFDLYDYRKDLGNQGPPDGERFRGRGFVQLTGRANYAACGRAIGLGNQLVNNPDLANGPDIAARLLAEFLKRKRVPILDALAAGDLRAARRLVNGGSNGLDRFTDAFTRGDALIPATAV